MRNAMPVRHAVLAAIMAATNGPAEAVERPWVELRSPHFVVMSNAGEKEGRGIAWQFEQVRSVFKALWPWARQEDDRAFVVLVARDEKTLRAWAPEYWEGRDRSGALSVYVSGADTDFVALRTDIGSSGDVRENPYEGAYEGYADNILVRHFSGRMPLWYREGLVEVFGNVIVRAKDVQVGRVIPGYLFRLTGGVATSATGLSPREDRRGSAPPTSAILPLQRLIKVGRGDPEFTGEVERPMFAAQAWGFVHFLMFGEGGVHRAAFNRLADLLRAGRNGDEATTEALGDVAALNPKYREYVSRRLFQYQRIDVAIDAAKDRWPARPVPPAEAAAMSARFHVAMGRAREARQLIADARQADPALAATYEVEALLLDREGDAEGAHAALLRAEELGSRSPWVLARLGRRPVSAATPTPRGASDAVPKLIAACGDGDDAACGRFAALLQVACDGGDAAMCMPLAWLHAKGRGVARDVIKAETLYARACDGGEAKACADLARLILERSGAEGDVARARQLLQRACAAGEATACGAAGKK